MRLPILTARYWTIGPLEIAPGWLMLTWRRTDWMLACLTCGRLTLGCRNHWLCGICQRCADAQERNDGPQD